MSTQHFVEDESYAEPAPGDNFSCSEQKSSRWQQEAFYSSRLLSARRSPSNLTEKLPNEDIEIVEMSLMAMRAACVGTWRWDLITNVILWSEEMRALCGMGPQDYSGRFDDFLKVLHPEDADRMVKQLQDIVTEAEACTTDEQIIEMQKKTHKFSFRVFYAQTSEVSYLQGFGKIVFDETTKKPKSMIGSDVDVTHQMQLEQARVKEIENRARIEEAQRYRSELLAFVDQVCHEFRNTNFGTAGNLNIMEELIADHRRVAEQADVGADSRDQLIRIADQLQESLDAMFECADHQRMILDDVLLMSKLESNNVTLSPQPCNIRDLLRSIVRIYKNSPYLREKHVDLKLEFIEPDGTVISDHGKQNTDEAMVLNSQISWCRVETDAFHLKQILMNFVSNAAKFTESGHITVRCKCVSFTERDVTLEISVQDTGNGISQQVLSTLFDRFRQAPHVAQKYGGSGLGLSICQRLLKLFDPNADIKVDSVVGSGSTFSFVLKCPLVAHDVVIAQSSSLACNGRDSSPGALLRADRLIQPATQQSRKQAVVVQHQIIPSHDSVASSELTNGINQTAVEAESSTSSCPPAQQQSRQRMIVVCEDNAINAKILQRFCQNRDFEVVVLADGAEAIRWFENLTKEDRARICLVFMDIMLPQADGFQITRRIRDLESQVWYSTETPIPVVGLSGHGREQHKEQALDAGMNELYAKPASKDTIYKIIDQYTN